MHTIGIDIGKETFHAAFDDQTVAVFDNTRSGVRQLLRRLKQQDYPASGTQIGAEATGAYHLLSCRILKEAGFSVKILNPLLAHRIISGSSLRQVKTDRHDALAIRQALLAGFGDEFIDTSEIIALKALIKQREALSHTRIQLKQRLCAHYLKQEAADVPLHNGLSGILKACSKEVLVLERRLGAYAKEDQVLLRSIPGVGKVTAASLVAYVGDIRRFPSPEKLVAYIGLDPRVYESGSSVKGKGYLTKRGNAYLRFILFNAAFIARRNNPDLKAYFEKKIKEGKHYFNAMCAVERKLVHVIHAVWSRRTPFEYR